MHHERKPHSRNVFGVCGYRASHQVDTEVLLILLVGRRQFAKLAGKAFITDDGEAIESTAADEIQVVGRVTFFINRAGDDDNPAICFGGILGAKSEHRGKKGARKLVVGGSRRSKRN